MTERYVLLVAGMWFMTCGMWPALDPGHDILASPMALVDLILHFLGLVVFIVQVRHLTNREAKEVRYEDR